MFGDVCGSELNGSKFGDVCGSELNGSKEMSGLNPDKESIGPFIAYEDGYKWPELFTEIDEMLESNIVIYPLAELRRKARDNEIEDGADMILKLPLTHAEVMQTINKNRDQLVDAKFVSNEFYLDVFRTADERNMSQALEGEEEKKDAGDSHITPAVIIAFDDEFDNEELVYSIELNHARKRITVCFRGSVTKTDWATDFEIYMKEVSNPMKAHASQEPTIRVHNGFFDYLFKPSSRGVKGPDGEDISEYQEIMQEHVLPVINDYPGYKVCLSIRHIAQYLY
jgi:hypothetical protein